LSIKSHTIPIAFNAGCYGTYLEWALTSLTSQEPIQLPFTQIGNSHLFLGNHLTNLSEWRDYISSDITHNFVRLHPKSVGDLSLIDNLLTLLSRHDKIIHLFPDESTYLLTANNQFTKVANDWWEYSFGIDLDPNRIYDNWPVSKNTPMKNVPDWIKREFLSLHYWGMWDSQLEWPQFKNFKHPRCCDVTVSDLLNNFENTILRIGKFCNLLFKRPVKDLLPAHKKMLSLQQHMSEDFNSKQLLSNAVNSGDYTCPELSLLSSSWVQHQLRETGLELACHGLDKFPTNSVVLQTIIYKADNGVI